MSIKRGAANRVATAKHLTNFRYVCIESLSLYINGTNARNLWPQQKGPSYANQQQQQQR